MNISYAMDKQHLDNLRHSCAHLLAAAVMELWPGAKRTIGPAIENGFYFDFDFSAVRDSAGGEFRLSENDLPVIEAKMRQILPTWQEFVRHELTAEEAKREYPDNPYKHELIDEFAANGQKVSFYKSGNYWDLCRGGHAEHPATALQHFQLLSIAGAYWRGSEKNAMLTRIYGTCFPTQAELDQYLVMLEEAKKRDHRKIGKEQRLFFVDDLVGKGLVIWLPNGTIIKNEVERLAIEMEAADGYLRVTTPHVAKEELYTTSGHLPYYKDSMYPAMAMDDGTYYLKAMNCPHHHRIYLHEPKSYRELPFRLAEYGTVYRNELSGTLAGLLRVRGLSMNDAHIYCRKDQIQDEFARVMRLTMKYFSIFNLKDYWFRLSKWSPEHLDKYINEPEHWAYAEAVLRNVLTDMQVPFVEVDDEAAFYGPKVDVQFKSAIGREETMSTIQLDFAAKKRFGLTYTDESGKDNPEVFVIHRAPLSTHERFMAFLIEHYGGVWPVWLAPEQVRFAPVSEKHQAGAEHFAAEFRAVGIRVAVDGASETIGNKVRRAGQDKVPYLIVVGDKELAGGDFLVRIRGKAEQENMTKESCIARIRQEIQGRQL